MTIDRKILLGILVVVIISPQYDGYKALGDRFATWKNDGYPAEEARCAVALTNSVSARKMK